MIVPPCNAPCAPASAPLSNRRHRAALTWRKVLSGLLLIMCAASVSSVSWAWSHGVSDSALPRLPGAGGPSDKADSSVRFLPVENDCTQGHLESAHQSLVVPATMVVCGDVTVLGADVTVEGTVEGAVRVLSGDVLVLGRIMGDVDVLRGNIMLGPEAQIGGKMHAWGGSVTRLGQTALPQSLKAPAPSGDVLPSLPNLSLPLPLQLLFWALFGLAMAILFPQQIKDINWVLIRAPIKSLVVGAIAIVATLLIALVLGVTVIGLPAAMFLLGVGWVVWALGTIAMGYTVAHMLVGKRLGIPFAILVLVGILALIGVEQIPWLGSGITALAGCLGVGTTIRWLAGTLLNRRYTRASMLQ